MKENKRKRLLEYKSLKRSIEKKNIFERNRNKEIKEENELVNERIRKKN